jgi:hypothetical protein
VSAHSSASCGVQLRARLWAPRWPGAANPTARGALLPGLAARRSHAGTVW